MSGSLVPSEIISRDCLALLATLLPDEIGQPLANLKRKTGFASGLSLNQESCEPDYWRTRMNWLAVPIGTETGLVPAIGVHEAAGSTGLPSREPVPVQVTTRLLPLLVNV